MAVSGGVIPVFQGGGPEPTFKAAAAITERRLVEQTANDREIQHAADESLAVVGVAKQTAGVAADLIAVSTSGVWKLVADAAISAGDQVVAAAAGRVKALAAASTALAEDINDARAVIGVALQDASAQDDLVEVLLRIS